jgi:hypothetical protein
VNLLDEVSILNWERKCIGIRVHGDETMNEMESFEPTEEHLGR